MADRLRKARKVSGMTQEQFARALDTTHAAYAAWESGRNQPPEVSVARAIQRVTGIPAEWTLGLMDPEPEPDGGLAVIKRPTSRSVTAARFSGEPSNSGCSLHVLSGRRASSEILAGTPTLRRAA